MNKPKTKLSPLRLRDKREITVKRGCYNGKSIGSGRAGFNTGENPLIQIEEPREEMPSNRSSYVRHPVYEIHEVFLFLS